MTLDDLYDAIAVAALGKHADDDCALALMILLHTHCIRLNADTPLADRPTVSELDPITQRQAATVLAAAWPDRSDLQRTDYRYWYWEFITRTPFEVMEDVPPEWVARVHHVRVGVISRRAVAGLEPEP